MNQAVEDEGPEFGNDLEGQLSLRWRLSGDLSEVGVGQRRWKGGSVTISRQSLKLDPETSGDGVDSSPSGVVVDVAVDQVIVTRILALVAEILRVSIQPQPLPPGVQAGLDEFEGILTIRGRGM